MVVNEAAILLLKIFKRQYRNASVLPHIHHQSHTASAVRKDLPGLRSVQREENRNNGFVVFLKSLEGEKKKAKEIAICFAKIL